MKRTELSEHTFEELGIAPKLLKRIDALGFVHPTPIQFKAIPVATGGEDVLGIAQTGSGKTLAFSIPMLQQISRQKKTGLVLLPTRELAVQVQETLKKVAGPIGLRTALLIGGVNSRPQIKQLKAKPHIIVATPGRLIDLVEQKYAKLETTGVLVLDEADRMLDMGFAPQLDKIMRFLPEDRQTMLFSATMPSEIVNMTRKYMKAPVRVEVARPGTTADKIDQEVFIVPKAEKMQLLERLLMEEEGSVLVFSRTKHGASKIARQIRRMGHTADEIHSNRSQNQRQKALKGFDKGKYRVLVATDIAARGIDVSHIKLVINYDLPDQLDDYVHRIGRTGRAGREGKAISFASPEQKRDVAKIQELINVILPIKSPSGEELAPIESQPKKKQGGRRNGRGGGRKRSGGSGSGGGRGRGGKKRAFTSRKNMSNKKRSNRSGGRGRKKSR
jgi:ATP-dependent RNA helicase RhlE